jgi:serine/threonine-protein kinase
LLRRCLAKDVRRRLDSAAAARLEVDDALAPSQEQLPSDASPAARPRRVAVALALLAAGILSGALATQAWLRSIPRQHAPPMLLSIVPPVEHPLGVTVGFPDVALSPDGRYLAYHSGPPSGGGQLILRPMARAHAGAPVAGISGGRSPFFSPDGGWIGFFQGGELSKVEVTGGPVLTISRALGIPHSASWGDDDTIVFATEGTNGGLRAVSASGGEPRVLTTIDATRDEVAHHSPAVLPRNRGVLFTIAVGRVGTWELAVLDLRTSKTKVLMPGAEGAQYVDTGHVVFAASGTLFAVGFDLDDLELRGEPAPLPGGLQVHSAGYPKFTVSRAGMVAFLPPQVPARSLVWVDRKGQETATGAPTLGYTTLTLSPDGKRVAVAVNDEERDVWVWDFATKTSRRLTFDPGTDWVPIWTPDGRWIVFRSNRGGRFNLYRQASDGSGSVERLTTSDNEPYPNAVTPDGQHVLGAELLPKTSFDIFRYPAVPSGSASSGQSRMADAGTARGTPFISSPSAQYAVRFAPNGRYIAYQSAASGRFEICVQPYPDLSQGFWQISTAGGWAPVWGRNGAELFYLDRSNTLMAVPVQTSAGPFNYGTPEKVFDAKYAGDFYSYDVAPDGQRFLMVKDTGADNRATILVALNVFENLRAAAPTAR